MPFPARIQPIDSIRNDVAKSPVSKSRLKRLFDRPRNVVLKIQPPNSAAEFEPSSVCLDRMVQNFIEDGSNEKHTSTAKCGRNRCCFSGNSIDSSDDELDFSDSASANNSSLCDPFDTLKSLIPCASSEERTLLAETSRIVEKNSKTSKRKDDVRKIVADGLIALGYNASVCKSKWEKASGIPAGEYEYIDVITTEGERFIIDVDFRSEFEIARSTSTYKTILQCLPVIFVGKSDRLLKIVAIASESLRRSLKKKGMHIAPWRKPEFIRSKWIAPYKRVTADDSAVKTDGSVVAGEKKVSVEGVEVVTWRLPAVKAKSLDKVVIVTGLASLLEEKTKF